MESSDSLPFHPTCSGARGSDPLSELLGRGFHEQRILSKRKVFAEASDLIVIESRESESLEAMKPHRMVALVTVSRADHRVASFELEWLIPIDDAFRRATEFVLEHFAI